tara:strand:- start:150 stop:1361 length:1212 start_codon:yes stop_codon:yes gene_type:complete
MKTLLPLLTLLLGFNIIIAQTTAIPDVNFEQRLITLGYDSGTPDGTIPTMNVDTITYLNLSSANISDLSGMEDFTSLEIFSCFNNPLINLDLSQNTALTELYLSTTPLVTIDLSQNTALMILKCFDNQLTSLDVSMNTNLIELWCDGNQLTNLDFTQNTNLTRIHANRNQLMNINITQNTNLTNLDLEDNQLINLDVSQNTNLIGLDCGENQLTNLNVSQNINLTGLGCYNNQLSSLNVSQNINLTVLGCHNNPDLTCLNIKNGNNFNMSAVFAFGNANLACIEVDNPSWSTNNWTDTNYYNFDSQASFSTNCPNPCPVGIDEYNLSNISLYPNPTNGVITVDLREATQSVKATLTNSLGQVLLTESYTSTNSINLDINAPNGIYFLQLESNGEVITKKIIKE